MVLRYSKETASEAAFATVESINARRRSRRRGSCDRCDYHPFNLIASKFLDVCVNRDQRQSD